jgi:hypothetical protein
LTDTISDTITGWAGMIKVDGTAYTWMGVPGASQNVIQSSFSYTSTMSSFVMDVGGVVQMNVTFLSPIAPSDIKRQSLTFSYISVAIQSTDGNSHDVELYADISAGMLFLSFYLFYSHRHKNGAQASEILLQLLLGIMVPSEV